MFYNVNNRLIDWRLTNELQVSKNVVGIEMTMQKINSLKLIVIADLLTFHSILNNSEEERPFTWQ